MSGKLSLCTKPGHREGLGVGGDHREPAIAWHSTRHRYVTSGIGEKVGIVIADVQQKVEVIGTMTVSPWPVLLSG